MPRPQRYIFDAAAIAAAIAVKLATPSPAWIEAHYSNGIYPVVDRVVRSVTQPLPFCLGDVLFFAALIWLGRYWIVSLRRARGQRVQAALRAALRALSVACAIFVWFVVSWAYNYSRIPLADKIVVHNERTDEDSVTAFANRVIDELSRYSGAAHREHLSDSEFAERLRPAFEATIGRLGDTAAFTPPHVKPTIFQPLMQLSETSGFTDPWTHEINLNAESFPVERPALYAHEWAHLSGFADEAEANFISVITCTTSRDPLLAYSGWILVWFNLPAGLHPTHHISRTAYNDIVAIAARYEAEANKQVVKAQRAGYDTYLKSNHVKAGYASYQVFVRWLVGGDFDRRGLPLVHAQNNT